MTLRRALIVIFGLTSVVRSASVSENNDIFTLKDLTPLVVKGNYSYEYTEIINGAVSYLFLYDYLPVNVF